MRWKNTSPLFSKTSATSRSPEPTPTCVASSGASVSIVGTLPFVVIAATRRPPTTAYANTTREPLVAVFGENKVNPSPVDTESGEPSAPLLEIGWTRKKLLPPQPAAGQNEYAVRRMSV